MNKNIKSLIELEITAKEEIDRMLANPLPKKPEMKKLWNYIIDNLKKLGFVLNGKKDVFLKNNEVTILINLQVSIYDKFDYYINIGFLIRAIKDPINPKFYFDASCFARIQIDNVPQEKILNEIILWIEKYSNIKNIKENLPLDKSLYNSTKLEVISYLNK